MIPSPALQLSIPATTPGAVLPGDGAETAEGADFAALLAQSVVPAALPDAAQVASAVVDPAITPPMPITAEPAVAPAEPAATPAIPGKILPVDLPLAALPEAPDRDIPKADPTDTPRPHDQRPVAHQLPLTAQAGKSRAAALRAQAGEKTPVKDSEPEMVQPALAIEPAQALAITPAPALPEVVQQIVPALNATSQADTPTIPNIPVFPPIPASPAGISAAVDPALARAEPSEAAAPVVRALTDKAAPQPQLIAAPQITTSQAATPQTAAVQATAQVAAPALLPLTQVRLDVPLPDALRPLRFETARAAPLLAATLGDELEVPASAVASPAPAAVSPTLFPSAAPAPLDRPHDFSALIDRLAAAREAAAPQSISISLPHADFGRVQLHFRNEDGALAVSLTSADPDFARVAAQAAPPVLTVGDARSAEHSSGQSSARSDGQAASASQQGSQRGQSDERRSERQSRFEHLPRPASPDKGRGRSGIFA